MWILLIAPALASIATNFTLDPDANRSFQDLCTHYGYQFQSHAVITKDGYILTVYRIPGKLSETDTNGKPVIFLQHGLIDSADTWIVNDPDKAVGFYFADKGYDVWLGNSRGNKYSQSHTTLDPSSKAFWEFSWQQMGQYDVPAVVQYALKTSGQSKLTYVGHSQGNTQMLAYLSEHPEFMDNIILYVGLAPVATPKNMTDSILQVLKSVHIFSLLDTLGIHEFLPYPGTIGGDLFYETCHLLGFICNTILTWFADESVDADNLARLPVMVAHEPGGTSCMDMEHWQQLLDTDKQVMRKYDYGSSMNMQVYGQPTPPDYDLSKVPGPIAFWSGVYDKVADPQDVTWLVNQLSSGVLVYNETDLPFGHMSFLWAKDMSYLDRVHEQIQKYSQNLVYV